MKATFLVSALFIAFQVGMPSYAFNPGEEEAWAAIEEKFGENQLNFLRSLRKAFCSDGKLEDKLKGLSHSGPKGVSYKKDVSIIKMGSVWSLRRLKREQYSFMDSSENTLMIVEVFNYGDGIITFIDPTGVILYYNKWSGDNDCTFVEAKLESENEILEINFKGRKNHTIKKEAIRDISSAETCSLPEEDFYFDQVYAAADNQKKVRMAIMDDGFDFNHPALASRFRQGQEDVAKIRFNTPSESEGHGTAVAGVALKNSRHIQFIPVEERVVGSDGKIEGDYFPHERILKAGSSGARVMNISLGVLSEGDPFYAKQELEDSKDVLFVASAGNEDENNDVSPHYPSNFSSKLDNVISVAATDQNLELADFSNFGPQTVDVAAPGVGIKTTVPLCMDETSCSRENDGRQDGFQEISGTSFSAPFVSNVAAKILLIHPNLTPPQVKKIIMETVDKKSWLKDKIKSGGVVNPDRAYQVAFETKAMSNDVDFALESIRSHKRLQKAAQGGLEEKVEHVEQGKKYLPESIQKLESIFGDTGENPLTFKKVK
ncbi:MAG: S8 family serine peptidase [Deltaproteobacteria bacterium]|nr:S8 family serine peptidase [Deltaproteobacteria bacterium]